jgi:hypothetical protein
MSCATLITPFVACAATQLIRVTFRQRAHEIARLRPVSGCRCATYGASTQGCRRSWRMQSAARLPAWRRRSAQHSMTHQQGMRLPAHGSCGMQSLAPATLHGYYASMRMMSRCESVLFTRNMQHTQSVCCCRSCCTRSWMHYRLVIARAQANLARRGGPMSLHPVSTDHCVPER